MHIQNLLLITLLATGLFASDGPSHAEDHGGLPKDVVLERLIAAGTNENDHERHTVKVNGCVMTTFRWKHFEGEGFILFTSIKFDMSAANLLPVGREGQQYIYEEQQEKAESIHLFQMVKPAKARLEMPERRKSERERADITPSPREAQEPYFYSMNRTFFISHDNPGSEAKPAAFARYFELYKERFCSVVG